MSDDDPRARIAREPMTFRQILAILTASACAASEGFDVQSISFASPGIARDWGVDRAVLGVVLSMELVGMAIGAVVIGAIADRVGRRPTILACLVIMASGMGLASAATDVATLSTLRFYTGLGIGGMLATTCAIVAESANDRRRSLAITLMIGGYSFGAVAGGGAASLLLARTDRWQAVFELGALSTAALLPLVLLFLPESISFLCQRQPKDALSRVNRILVRQGRRAIDRLPPPVAPGARRGVGALFHPGMAGTTVALTVAFFMYMTSLYFLLKWIPKLVADMGYPAASAGAVLVWANMGGIAGTIVLGVLMERCNVRHLVIGALICGSVAVVAFGQSPAGMPALVVVAAGAGFSIIGANSGFYSMVAQAFPGSLRAGGTGFVIGAGRAGSALGPIAAGLLFEAGWSLAMVSASMACGCLVAAAALSRVGDPEASTASSAGLPGAA